MKDLSIYKKLITTYKLPRVNDIPELELYMDQVIIYVKKYFSIFPYATENNFITPSMINNYVKSGLMPAPVKKKYTRRHIAYIFVIFFLKQIFSLEEIKAFINYQIEYTDEQTAYETFCSILESELKNCVKGSKISETENKTAPAWEQTLRHATISIAYKLYTQTLIKNQL